MDKFTEGDFVILTKDRLDFERGTVPHPPNTGVVQNYVRPTGLLPKVLVRWHRGYARFYLESQLEKQPTTEGGVMSLPLPLHQKLPRES